MQKYFKAISQFIKIFCLLFFLLAGFFRFGNLKVVQAYCDYRINRFDPEGLTSASPSTVLHFKFEIERLTDNLSQCDSQNSVFIRINTSPAKFVNESGTVLNFQQGKASGNVDFNLANFDRSVLNPPNVINFQLFVVRGTSFLGGQIRAESSVWTVNISGAVGGTGQLRTNIYFQPNKGQFTSGEKVKIFFDMTPSSYFNSRTNKRDFYDSDISPSIQNFYLETKINGQKAGGFTKSRTEFATSAQYQEVDIATVNAFRDGSNNIEVGVWEAGTSQKITGATATLQATGLGTSGPGNGTTTPPGGTTTPPGGGGPTPNPANLPTDRLFNPLPADNLLPIFIVIVKGFLTILGALAIMFIIIGGFRLVISAGNEEAVIAAKKTITWAVLGLVIAGLSFSIVAIVQNLLRAKLTP